MSIRPTAILILLTVIFGISAALHPYHVTVTTLNHHNKSGVLDIEIKCFLHDFESAIHKFGDVKIDIKNTTDTLLRDSLVNAYVMGNFGISNNGEVLRYQQIKVGFKDEYIIMRTEAKVRKPEELVISNSICFEIEKTQSNIVHYKVGDIKINTQKSINPVNEIFFQL